MARFSNKMLNELRDTYERRINQSRDVEESAFRTQKSNLKNIRQVDMVAAIIKAAMEAGGEKVSVTDSTEYNGKISLRVVCEHENMGATDPEIVAIDEKRRESCRLHKKMHQDLEDWVIRCIENQEIIPFSNVPDVERSEIVCL